MKLIKVESLQISNKFSELIPEIKIPSPLNYKAGLFLKGPIPMNWLEHASKLPGKALHVAIWIWFWSGIKKSKEIRLSSSKLEEFGVSRHAGYRGLRALENAKLVSVKRHRGRLPIVTLLQSPSNVNNNKIHE